MSLMAARWMVSRWVSAPMTTRREDVTMGLLWLGVNPVGRADKTLMRNGQAPD